MRGHTNCETQTERDEHRKRRRGGWKRTTTAAAVLTMAALGIPSTAHASETDVTVDITVFDGPVKGTTFAPWYEWKCPIAYPYVSGDYYHESVAYGRGLKVDEPGGVTVYRGLPFGTQKANGTKVVTGYGEGSVYNWNGMWEVARVNIKAVCTNNIEKALDYHLP
jgi:hypothetical protein